MRAPTKIIGIPSLPSGAADKLRALRQRVDDLHRLLPEFEVRRLAGEARLAAEQRLKRLTDHQQDGGFSLGPDDPRVIAAQRDLKTLTAEARRVSDNYERKAAAWREAGSVLSNVESWLSGGKPSGVVLRDHADETPKINGDLLMFVETQRRRVRELKSDIARIDAAPFPSAHCKQKLREHITALAERGRPSVSRLVEYFADAEFADELRTVPIIAGSKEAPVTTMAAWQQPDVLALVAWLHRDALIERLDAEIDSEADDKSALSHAERERQAAEVQADLLATERTECAAVWLAWSQNLPVEFRPDTKSGCAAQRDACRRAGNAIAGVEHRTRHRPCRVAVALNTNRARGRYAARLQRHSSSRSRRTASLAGFLDLSHVFDGPLR